MTSTLTCAAAAILLVLAGTATPAGDRGPAADAPAATVVPLVERVLRVSIGDDGAMATVVTLRGPGAEEAVVLRRGSTSTLVARTGEPVVTADGRRFGLRAIGRAWTAGGSVAWLGTTDEGPPVLVLHDGAGNRVVAAGADPTGALAAAAPRPRVEGAECAVELEVFGLLATGAAPLRPDGTLRFPAWLGEPCAGAEATVRHVDGIYSIDGAAVAGAAATNEPAESFPPALPGPWTDAARADVAGEAAGAAPRP